MTKEIRIRIDDELYDKLQDFYNKNRKKHSTFSSAIREILDYKTSAKSPQNADISAGLPHVRATLPSEVTNNYIPKKEKRTTPKKRACSIPKDFNPPAAIASDENIDHKKAVEFFRNWAESNDKKYVDWIACYKNACRTWLQGKIPPPSKSTKVNRISLD